MPPDGQSRTRRKQVNNAIAESQLEDVQYKLSRRNEKYSRERSKQAIEQEVAGMRKEIHKGDIICYGDTSGEVDIKALDGRDAFI